MCTFAPVFAPVLPITMITAQELRLAMNELGMLGTPYLFAVDFAKTKGWILPHPMDQKEVLFQVGDRTNADPQPTLSPLPSTPLLEAHPISFEDYRRKFDPIQQALLRGDSFLANLTIATPIDTPLSLQDIFYRAQAPYKLMVDGAFVAFSPERFVRSLGHGRTIETNPMKGTIDAALPDAREQILNDYKETAEHYTIVDLMRNDLARIATRVRVEDFRYIDRIRTIKGELLQVSSRIAADLPPDASAHWGDLLMELLPAGSISGAPKEATLRAIAEAEGESRGFYTGVFGYFDGYDLDTGVLIRFIAQRADGSKVYHSGGGITINSQALDEYHEAIAKVYLPFS